MTHEDYMQIALKEAEYAGSIGEVPVGAIIVCNEKIIARAHNLCERLNDPTAHAEMQVITMATNTLGGKYLPKCTMYVTLEPCIMCAGASHWAQLGELVFGTYDTKKGFTTLENKILHPKTNVVRGVLSEECGSLVSNFFLAKR